MYLGVMLVRDYDGSPELIVWSLIRLDGVCPTINLRLAV